MLCSLHLCFLNGWTDHDRFSYLYEIIQQISNEARLDVRQSEPRVHNKEGMFWVAWADLRQAKQTREAWQAVWRELRLGMGKACFEKKDSWPVSAVESWFVFDKGPYLLAPLSVDRTEEMPVPTVVHAFRKESSSVRGRPRICLVGGSIASARHRAETQQILVAQKDERIAFMCRVYKTLSKCHDQKGAL